jgi:hypothetical protein
MRLFSCVLRYQSLLVGGFGLRLRLRMPSPRELLQRLCAGLSAPCTSPPAFSGRTWSAVQESLCV